MISYSIKCRFLRCPDPQPKFNWYLRFINCYGKANKKYMPWQSERWLGIDCVIGSQKDTYTDVSIEIGVLGVMSRVWMSVMELPW